MSNSVEQISSHPESNEAILDKLRKAIGAEAVRIWSDPGMEVLNSPQQRFVKVDLERNVALMHFAIRGSIVLASLAEKELYLTSDGSIIHVSEKVFSSYLPQTNAELEVTSRGFSPSVCPKEETENWEELGRPVADEDLPALLEALGHLKPFDRGLIE